MAWGTFYVEHTADDRNLELSISFRLVTIDIADIQGSIKVGPNQNSCLYFHWINDISSSVVCTTSLWCIDDYFINAKNSSFLSLSLKWFAVCSAVPIHSNNISTVDWTDFELTIPHPLAFAMHLVDDNVEIHN